MWRVCRSEAVTRYIFSIRAKGMEQKLQYPKDCVFVEVDGVNYVDGFDLEKKLGADLPEYVGSSRFQRFSFALRGQGVRPIIGNGGKWLLCPEIAVDFICQNDPVFNLNMIRQTSEKLGFDNLMGAFREIEKAKSN